MSPAASPPRADPSAPPSRDDVSRVRAALVPWYRENARKLPWREDPSPYRVWVSEIMLQQTRVETVVPYFERFLERFPSLEALARASEEEVLEAWSGLGYYRRARALRAGAIRVLQEHGGSFPEDEKAALDLPGIGPYAAGAIRSIALGVRAPILDGNVTRILSRVFGIAGDVSKAAVRRVLWDVATSMVEADDPSDVNQAQMELGALVCTPVSPSCSECPLERHCVARRRGTVDRLPELPARRPTVDVRRVVLLVRHGDRVLLRQRRDEELSAGLWDLPGAFTGAEGDVSTGFDDAVSLLPFAIERGDELGRARHAVTYRRIALEVISATPALPLRRSRRRGPDGARLEWVEPSEALSRALSSPAREVLKRFGRARLDTPSRVRVS